ncbi:MAG: type II secretion system protein GspM [Thermodesulfovibrionales bacterium]|nr:type II secretion system protein GspM [Thermodesulfovibrionales bacterium]
MKKSRTLILTVPLMIILFGFLLYEYVYVRIQEDVALIKEGEEIKTKTLEKYVALIAEKPELEKQLDALKEERKAEETKLVEGQTLSLVAASLQEMVKDTITRSGATITSERVQKPEDLDAFKVIGVSIDTVVPDTRSLSDILYAIETRTPYLTIKDLDIRIRNYRDPREQVVKIEVNALTSSR